MAAEKPVSPAEAYDEWVRLNPRPEWDNPEHWASSRPKEAAGER